MCLGGEGGAGAYPVEALPVGAIDAAWIGLLIRLDPQETGQGGASELPADVLVRAAVELLLFATGADARGADRRADRDRGRLRLRLYLDLVLQVRLPSDGGRVREARRGDGRIGEGRTAVVRAHKGMRRRIRPEHGAAAAVAHRDGADRHGCRSARRNATGRAPGAGQGALLQRVPAAPPA